MAKEVRVDSQTISPVCRIHRGDDGAWYEAVSRLKTQYDGICEEWADEPQLPSMTLTLTMIRPPQPDSTQVPDMDNDG